MFAVIHVSTPNSMPNNSNTALKNNSKPKSKTAPESQCGLFLSFLIKTIRNPHSFSKYDFLSVVIYAAALC